MTTQPSTVEYSTLQYSTTLLNPPPPLSAFAYTCAFCASFSLLLVPPSIWKKNTLKFKKNGLKSAV